MAKTKRKAGKRATVAGRDKPRARKSGVPQTRKPGPRKPKPTKPAPRKRKPSLPSETARLKRADRRITVWPVKHHAADDLDARAQRDRIGRKPARLVPCPKHVFFCAHDAGC